MWQSPTATPTSSLARLYLCAAHVSVVVVAFDSNVRWLVSREQIWHALAVSLAPLSPASLRRRIGLDRVARMKRRRKVFLELSNELAHLAWPRGRPASHRCRMGCPGRARVATRSARDLAISSMCSPAFRPPEHGEKLVRSARACCARCVTSCAVCHGAHRATTHQDENGRLMATSRRCACARACPVRLDRSSMARSWSASDLEG